MNVVHTIDEPTDRLVRSVIDQYQSALADILMKEAMDNHVDVHVVRIIYGHTVTGYLTGIRDMLLVAGITPDSDERTRTLFNDLITLSKEAYSTDDAV